MNDPSGVVIDVRWVIVNKGTHEEPNVRCRLVGRECADKGNKDDLFAGTPPLVTIRILLSLLAKRAYEEEDIGGMVIDVKGAFLYGKTRGTFISGYQVKILKAKRILWASLTRQCMALGMLHKSGKMRYVAL